MNRTTLLSVLVMACLSFAVVIGSCRKKGDTIARIIVRDTAKMLVPDAQVILFGQSTLEDQKPVVLRDTLTTNASGVAITHYNDNYQLGQAGFAVLDIIARKDGLTGKGIIKVEEEKVNEVTVFIQP